MTCPVCKEEVEVDSSYCRFCGAAVHDDTRPRQLRRLPAEGKIAGVCAGLAEYVDADVTLVRLAWVALSIVPGLLLGGVLAYLIAWLFVPHSAADHHSHYTGKRLVRSTGSRMIGGVCEGLADYLGVDTTIVRVLYVVLSIYPGAIVGGVIGYLIAWWVIPQMPVTLTMNPVSA